MLYGYGMKVSVLAVYPHDLVMDQELWLAAAARHHEKYCTACRQSRKTWKCKIQSKVSTECVSFAIIKLKNQKVNHCKLETVLSLVAYTVSIRVGCYSTPPQSPNATASSPQVFPSSLISRQFRPATTFLPAAFSMLLSFI